MARPKLFGVDIAGEIARGLGSQMLDAVLTKVTPGTRGAGSLTAGRTVDAVSTAYPCKGFTEAYSDFHLGATAGVNGGRDSSLIMAGDRKVTLFGGTLPDAIDPKPGDTITIEGETWRIVGDVKRDPVAATFICQGRK